MRFLKNFFTIALAVTLLGCAAAKPNLKIKVSKGANPWTNLKFYNDPGNFQFAIVSDRTGGGQRRRGVFENAVEKLNLLKPEFVISVGDLIQGGIEDENKINRQWDGFDKLVNNLDMPFFYVPGNHDISNAVMEKIWHQRLGASYYHFVYRNVLFLCLYTGDDYICGRQQPGCISEEQIEYFRKVIKANKNVRWTLVFMHHNFWQKGKTSESLERFEALLSDRPYTVFAGQEHVYSKTIRNGRRYYILSVTGGGGSGERRQLLGLDSCEFDHIVWVTMTNDGPVIANLLLDGILNDEPCPQKLPEQTPK